MRGRIPSMTVVMHPANPDRPDLAIRYDAQMIVGTLRDGDQEPMLAFLCSRTMITVEARRVARIEYYADGSSHCHYCDTYLPLQG